MANKNQGNSRFIKFINHLMDTLKEERNNVNTATDEYINQVQREVDGFVTKSHNKKATYEEISNKLQQAITFFIASSEELSVLMGIENESDEITNSVKHNPQPTGLTTSVVVGSSSSQSMTIGVTTVEETLLSLKRTMEHLQEKQEHFDKTIKDISTQQENFNKEIEILTIENSSSQKMLKERLMEVEKTSLESSATVDNLNKVFSVNVDARVTRLEKENKSVNASMNKLNKQISSLKSCSNDVITSTQVFLKRVESTDQQYNEVSDKLNQLEISLNLLSSQYKEQFEKMCSVNKEKIDECIGTVCQLLAKRLNPLEKINETLNKKLNSSEKLSTKVDDVEIQVTKLAEVFKEMELKCSHPNVGFNAQESTDVTNTFSLVNFENAYSKHFNSSTGTFTAPLDGFYLVSLSASANEKNSRFCVSCMLEESPEDDCCYPLYIYSVSENKSDMRCIELKAGNSLYLLAETLDGSASTSVLIKFCCCLIR